MRRFFTSWGILLAAWLLVLAAMGGGLTLALLQPPGVPPSNPAAVSIEAQDPEASGATAEIRKMEGAAEAEMEQPEAPDAAAKPVEGEKDGPREIAPPSAETAEEIPPAPETPAQDAAAETGKAVPPKDAEAPEAAKTDDPAMPVEPEDSAAGPAQPEQGPDESAPAPQGDTAGAPAGDTGGHGESSGEEAQGDQLVAIPVIPPAPEDLAYWERYRQPFNMNDQRPRIAVVLSGLGLSDSATEAAIKQLPAAVTLSFSPYARDLERWIALARARGHEVMLDLPMEPASFPNEDPGPQGLLTHLTMEDNLDRLDWVLSRGSAYVGLAGAMGSRFTASRGDMEPVLKDIKKRGLIFLDRRTTEHSVVPQVAQEIGLPTAVNSRSVDERQASRVAIDARLAQIERIALTRGFAVAMAQPYPVTIERLADWATELTGRGFVMAPISALADQQTQP